MQSRRRPKIRLSRIENISFIISAWLAISPLIFYFGDRALFQKTSDISTISSDLLRFGVLFLPGIAVLIISGSLFWRVKRKIRMMTDYFKRSEEQGARSQLLFKSDSDDDLVYLNLSFNKAIEDRFYRKLFENSPIAVYQSRLDGKLISHNKGFSDLLGYDYRPGSVCLDLASAAYADPADRVKFIEKIKANCSISNERLCLKKKHGSLIWVSANAILLRNPRDTELCINGFLTDISYLMQEQDELLSLAETDPLTGIANRRAFMKKLENACSYARAHASISPDDPSASVSVLMIDLDHFKPVNDQFGHDAGDQVLKDIARIGKAATRKGDVFARLGGDEFIMLIPMTGMAEAKTLAERFVKGVAELPLYAIDLSITVSVGIASRSGLDVWAETLLRESDAAMYFAKQSGRNRICTFG